VSMFEKVVDRLLILLWLPPPHIHPSELSKRGLHMYPLNFSHPMYWFCHFEFNRPVFFFSFTAVLGFCIDQC